MEAVINTFLQQIEELQEAGVNIQQLIDESNYQPKMEKEVKKPSISFDDIKDTDETVGINMQIPKKIDDVLTEYQRVYKEFSGNRKPRKDMLVWYAICHGIDSIKEKTASVREMMANKADQSSII